ncbi:MAG TPA: peptide deformylase [Minicystis sp.]|nr:peptide deformylase [Minicystis sp.]
MSALPPIVQTGHPVLRNAARPVPPEMLGSAELASLVRTMIEVMRNAPGVGLAAPQIGVPLRVVVMEDAEELMQRLSDDERAERGRTPLPLTVLVNPEMRPVGDAQATFFEGCLSVGGYMALVERRLEVEVKGLDEKGKPVAFTARGWPARIVQHELDHLDGTLYVDRMITRSFCENGEMKARWLGRSVDEVRAALKA